MKRIVILISGLGSNMQAIVRSCATEGWSAQVVAVISNRPGAPGLAFAAGQGIATAVVDHLQQPSRELFDAELARVIDGFAPDLVLLAGFMRILGDGFVARYEGRMLNIHPSLLPSFAGLHTHRRAIEAGCKLAGATVHFVTTALDQGAIVAQAAVPVRTIRERPCPLADAPNWRLARAPCSSHTSASTPRASSEASCEATAKLNIPSQVL